jgi:hypothetical protein
MLVSGGRSAAFIIAAIFIYIGTIKEEKFSSYYYLFTGNSTKRKLIDKDSIRKRFIRVNGDTHIRWVVNRLSPVTLCYVQVIDDTGKVIRVLNEDEIMRGFLMYGYDGRIEQIINN